MSPSRRHFLKTAAATIAAAGFTWPQTTAATASAPHPAPSERTRPMWAHSLLCADYTDRRRDPASPVDVAREMHRERNVIDLRRCVAWYRDVFNELERLGTREFISWNELQARESAARALGID